MRHVVTVSKNGVEIEKRLLRGCVIMFKNYETDIFSVVPRVSSEEEFFSIYPLIQKLSSSLDNYLEESLKFDGKLNFEGNIEVDSIGKPEYQIYLTKGQREVVNNKAHVYAILGVEEQVGSKIRPVCMVGGVNNYSDWSFLASAISHINLIHQRKLQEIDINIQTATTTQKSADDIINEMRKNET